MTRQDVAVIFLLVCNVIWCLLLGFYRGALDRLRAECVERGCAQYNPTTGEWEWKQ